MALLIHGNLTPVWAQNYQAPRVVSKGRLCLRRDGFGAFWVAAENVPHLSLSESAQCRERNLQHRAALCAYGFAMVFFGR
jgi:hypothetical protein